MLGKKVKCKITGFEGIATAKVEYINGCFQYCVKPKMTDSGQMPIGEYIDVEQLEVVSEGVKIKATPTGGGRKDSPPKY